MEAFVAYMEDGNEEKAKAVRAIEKHGDELKLRNTDILNRAFATPMDREDIYNAIITLDMGMNYTKTTTREMEALSLVDDVVAVDERICFGCGNCVSVCPTESLSMVRRASVIPPQAKERLSQMGLE